MTHPSRRLAAGQGLVEFGLILSLAVLVAAVVVIFLGPQLSFVLSLIGAGIEGTS
jgi:hypothetical protein